MSTKRFVYGDASSNKFWEIQVDGRSHTVRFGKLGTAGQTKIKSFDSPAAAQADADKLIASKTKKGYVPAGKGAAKGTSKRMAGSAKPPQPPAKSRTRQAKEAAPKSSSRSALDIDALCDQLTARLCDKRGKLNKGAEVRVLKEAARLNIHRVSNDDLGLEVVRLFDVGDGDEVVGIRGGGRKDGFYHLDHNEGLITVEELGGDARSLVALGMAKSQAALAKARPDARIAMLEKAFGIGRIARSTRELLDQVEIETWEVRKPKAKSAVNVERVHKSAGRVGLVFDDLLYVGGDSVFGFDGRRRKHVQKVPDEESLYCGCVHDGALYFGGVNSVLRWMPGKKLERVEVKPHPDVRGLSFDPAFKAMASHQGELWAGGRKGALVCQVGKTLEHQLSAPSDIRGMVSHEGQLYLGLNKGGLMRLEKRNKLAAAGVKGVKLVQILASQSGALLVVSQGPDRQPGIIYRCEHGKKSFAPHRLAKDCIIVRLCQLPNGRLVGAGLWGKVLVSDDDGVTFRVLEMKGADAGSYDFAVTWRESAYIGGSLTPLLKVT